MVQGLSHITIIVKDLQRTARLFCEALGAEEIYDSGDRQFSLSREKFFNLAGIWLVAMEGDVSEKSYRHIAFKVEESNIQAISAQLTKLDIEIIPSRPRVSGEGTSLYFRDYDHNLFELHTGTLAERLARYRT